MIIPGGQMNIRCKSMLGTHHSWAITMRSLLAHFHKQDHNLYLESINGDTEISNELKDKLNKKTNQYDLDITYTMPRNFQSRFDKNSKLKMAIYNYETEKLPKMWADSYKYLDYVLPSSTFSKKIFTDAGWPEEKCIVVPHGINLEEYQIEEKFKLNTQKKFKFLNVSIPHYRKNISLLLEAYYSAFSDQDDVCLILKTDLKKPQGRKLYNFEVDLTKEISELQKKYFNKTGGLPQVEVIQNKIPSMVPLYKSCDVLVNAASSEGFGLPLLEGLASGNLIIAPNCSGQLDFLNKQNALLVDVKEIDAGIKYQYWYATPGAKTYLPKLESLSENLIKAYQNKEILKQQFQSETNKTIEKFSWEAAAKQILEIR